MRANFGAQVDSLALCPGAAETVGRRIPTTVETGSAATRHLQSATQQWRTNRERHPTSCVISWTSATRPSNGSQRSSEQLKNSEAAAARIRHPTTSDCVTIQRCRRCYSGGDSTSTPSNRRFPMHPPTPIPPTSSRPQCRPRRPTRHLATCDSRDSGDMRRPTLAPRA